MKKMETTYEFAFQPKPSPAYHNRRLAEKHRHLCLQDHIQPASSQVEDGQNFKQCPRHPNNYRSYPHRKGAYREPTHANTYAQAQEPGMLSSPIPGMTANNNYVYQMPQQYSMYSMPSPMSHQSSNLMQVPTYMSDYSRPDPSQNMQQLSEASPIPGVYTNAPGLTVPDHNPYDNPSSNYMPLGCAENCSNACCQSAPCVYSSTYWGPLMPPPRCCACPVQRPM